MQSAGALPSIVFGLALTAISMHAPGSEGVENIPCPIESADARMTEGKFLAYMDRFNTQDPAFVDFYADDIVFDRGEAGILEGKDEILAFYQKAWSRIDERIWHDAIVIDNENGIMMVDLTVELLAKKDLNNDSAISLERGEHLILREVLVYGIESGLIKSIYAPENFRVVTKGGDAFPLNEFTGSPTPLLKEALETAYEEYAVCFSAQDTACLQRFLAADVEFISQSLPRLDSRNELLDFFGGLWRSLGEDLTVHGYRYEKGWMFVDLANTLTVHERIPDLGGRPLETGQHHLRGEVGYKIIDGKISKIYDGIDPFAEQPAQRSGN